MLVGGDPGIGKSTLLLQVAAGLAAAGRRVVYVSGEEAANQVRLRAIRLGLGSAPVELAAATSVRDILTTMGSGQPVRQPHLGIQADQLDRLAAGGKVVLGGEDARDRR